MNRGKIFLYCDRVIIIFLCFVIFCLPFSKAGIESFIWPVIFIFILKRFLGYKGQAAWGLLPKTGLNTALGILVIFTILSVVFSTNFGLSLRGFFGKELKFLALYFIIVEVINNSRRLKVMLGAIIISALFIIIDAGVMYFKGVDFLRGHETGVYPFCASFFTSTGFAAWLIVIIPIFIGIIAAKIIPELRFKILLLAAIIVQSLYLIKTCSRGGWFGFLVGILLIAYYVFKNSSLLVKKICVITAVSLLCISLLLPQSVVTNVKSYIGFNLNLSQVINERLKSMPQTNKDSATSARILLWRESLKIIRDYPLIGCGLNTYSIVAKKYKSFDEGGIYPHNSYLQKAAETGLCGLLAFLLVLCSFFRMGMRYLNQKKDYLALGFLSGILAFLVHAFFDTHLYSLQLVVLFWYMLGLTVAIIQLRPSAESC
ncbi:MAG: O-antigen ligase family protein [Candidatus Omnitrophica bacterium]|nr:O-antigen ligase family protein [Candidatus Omnitrophota bacterium]MBU1924138.1 O-antigen ligase family protein [Candidatus Omnitrophota bacterium]